MILVLLPAIVVRLGQGDFKAKTAFPSHAQALDFNLENSETGHGAAIFVLEGFFWLVVVCFEKLSIIASSQLKHRLLSLLLGPFG